MTKIITEDTFNELCDEVLKMEDNEYTRGRMSLLVKIRQEFTELDQLTVTKLRPMSEVPNEEDEKFFVKIKGKDKLQFAVIFQGQIIDQYFDWIDPSNLEGWIAMPKYKPKQS